jgi:hypothetical protein
MNPAKITWRKKILLKKINPLEDKRKLSTHMTPPATEKNSVRKELTPPATSTPAARPAAASPQGPQPPLTPPGLRFFHYVVRSPVIHLPFLPLHSLLLPPRRPSLALRRRRWSCIRGVRQIARMAMRASYPASLIRGVCLTNPCWYLLSYSQCWRSPWRRRRRRYRRGPTSPWS